ncbi:RNA 3'-terminal phosphate cyclase [Candidatus Woesearchaeota archaeon]|nr:RNA 3'-terminal phosphate cyclase [Candidatus Woesearchaeota archaeon]
MIKLNGTFLEGGGQMLRTALALSVLTQKPFTIDNIRANRAEPGLKQQHLVGVRAIRDLCDGVVEGAQIGSSQITFYPRKIAKGVETAIDIETAGSITLLLQTLLLPCLFSGKRFQLTLKGGTDVSWSPQYDYFANIDFPQFLRYGAGTISLKKRGYYPKGQGEVLLDVKKKILFDDIAFGVASVRPLSLLEQGTLVKIAGVSHASTDLADSRVAERQAQAATAHLIKWKVPVEIVSSYGTTASTGSGITLWAIFTGQSHDADSINPIRLGADILGEKNKRAEIVGEECALQLNATLSSAAPVDKHLADQLIPLLGIVGGEIAVQEITNHTLTNVYVVEKFLDVRFDVDEKLRMIKMRK